MEEGGGSELDFHVMQGVSFDSLGNFEILGEKLLDILSDHLGFSVPSIIMYDHETDGLRIMKYRTPKSIDRLVHLAVGKKIPELLFPLTCTENVFVKAFLSRQTQVVTSVRQMVVPFFDSSLVSVIDKYLGVKMMAVTPVVVDDKSVGVLVFGSSTKSDVDDREKKFLQSLSQQFGHYLKHAWLMYLLTAKNKRISVENHQLKKMITINQQMIVNVSSVLQSLAESMGVSDEQKMSIYNQLSYIQSVYLITNQVKNESD